MPVYNAESFVAASIKSLLRQTFGDFELIVVDDGSTDKSFEIAAGFADRRIRIFKNETNFGIVYSRNRGISEMKGRFYAPFDSDDIARKDKFEKQITFMVNNPEYAMTGTWAKLINENGKPLRQKWKLNAAPERIPSIMLFRNYFVHSSIVVRRRAMEGKYYQPGLDVVEDYRFCADLAFHHKVINYPDYLIHYRIHSNSAMRKDETRMRKQDEKIYNYIFNSLKINLTEFDLKCIFALKNKRNIEQLSQLRAIHNFLILILEQNKQVHFLNQMQLEKTIANRWLKACYLSKNHHANLLSEMISSPLTKLTFRI